MFSDAAVSDMDGVVTQTAIVHCGVWKQLFDAELATQEPASGRRHDHVVGSRGTVPVTPKVLPRPDHRHRVDMVRESRVESGPTSTAGALALMGQQHRHRRFAAIAIRADGRRVPMQLPDDSDVSLLAKLGLVVLELIGILTGSRRETGGRRR